MQLRRSAAQMDAQDVGAVLSRLSQEYAQLALLQVPMQEPLPQFRPQAPQFSELFGTQRPSQANSESGSHGLAVQTSAPRTHAMPGETAWPQRPQLSGSWLRSTQPVGQADSGAVQAGCPSSQRPPSVRWSQRPQ